MVFDPVGNDFGVGLRFELESVFQQIGTQFLEIFDDPVVHDRDVIFRHVGMGIGLVRNTVRRPSGV